jgi:hypothetical protein
MCKNDREDCELTSTINTSRLLSEFQAFVNDKELVEYTQDRDVINALSLLQAHSGLFQSSQMANLCAQCYLFGIFIRDKQDSPDKVDDISGDQIQKCLSCKHLTTNGSGQMICPHDNCKFTKK